MPYKIRHIDGDIYTFKNVEEVLQALVTALGMEHEYYWFGGWYEGGQLRLRTCSRRGISISYISGWLSYFLFLSLFLA